MFPRFEERFSNMTIMASGLKGEMMEIIKAWKAEGGRWPATSAEIADFAVRRKLYHPHARIRRLCARDLADAMREEYFIDELGRPIRRMHSARFAEPKEDGRKVQRAFWNDIDVAEFDFMQVAFQQRRQQVVGECRQLSNDVDYYNRRHRSQPQIQLVFDFRDDIEEANQPGQYSLPPKG